MSIVSIEEAVLSFVRRVKDDPGLSDLFRDALHEFELLLDPSAAEQAPAENVDQQDGQPESPPPPVDASPDGEQAQQDG